MHRQAAAAEEKALKYQRTLTDITGRVDKTLALQYMVDGRDHLLPLLLTGIAMFAVTLILAFVAPAQLSILGPAVVLWVIVIVQALIAVSAPSTLFGHWKDDRFKEKLEWDAFTRFLSDMAMMQKYAPEDLSMWGEWLVYGTALGVGDKVEKAMKALNIRIAETGVPIGVHGNELCLYPASPFHASESWRCRRRRIRGWRLWRRRRIRRWRCRGKIIVKIFPPFPGFCYEPALCSSPGSS